MNDKSLTIDIRLERIDIQLDRIIKVIVKGFEDSRLDRHAIRDKVKQTIDFYARAAETYAKQS